MIIYLCSCGIASDIPEWLDGHLDEHPGHYQRRTLQECPAITLVPVMLPVRP